MKFVKILSIAAIAPLPLYACSSMTGGELLREGEPTATLRVTNDASNAFTAITISQCDAMSHGFNRLPSGVNVPSGASYDFTVSTGCYDVMAGWGETNGYSSSKDRVTVTQPGVNLNIGGQ